MHLLKFQNEDKMAYQVLNIFQDAFDYIEFYILFLAILCVAIAASTFAGEYQTGADSIHDCFCKSYDTCDIFCSGTSLSFLSSTMNERTKF